MKTVSFLFSMALLLVISGCQSGPEEIEPEVYDRYIAAGDEITNRAQSVLLAHVSKAMQAGGPEYAVEFCNLEVSGITDSLNRAGDVSISRISSKYRNPNNAPHNKTEKELLDEFEQKIAGAPGGDTLIRMNDQLVYYKTIRTAMPACMNCHGEPGTGIKPATLEKINNLYPDDKATGYVLNDFRGLWKVEFGQ